MVASRYSNLKVDALISGHISLDGSWTEQDFAALALAAADQAGASVTAQAQISALLPACDVCGEFAHGPCVSPCVYCDEPSVTTEGEARCQECEDSFVRVAARERREAEWEGYGDAMRDARKDEL